MSLAFRTLVKGLIDELLRQLVLQPLLFVTERTVIESVVLLVATGAVGQLTPGTVSAEQVLFGGDQSATVGRRAVDHVHHVFGRFFELQVVESFVHCFGHRLLDQWLFSLAVAIGIRAEKAVNHSLLDQCFHAFANTRTTEPVFTSVAHGLSLLDLVVADLAVDQIVFPALSHSFTQWSVLFDHQLMATHSQAI